MKLDPAAWERGHTDGWRDWPQEKLSGREWGKVTAPGPGYSYAQGYRDGQRARQRKDAAQPQKEDR